MRRSRMPDTSSAVPPSVRDSRSAAGGPWIAALGPWIAALGPEIAAYHSLQA
jgi:hypothetical protein